MKQSVGIIIAITIALLFSLGYGSVLVSSGHVAEFSFVTASLSIFVPLAAMLVCIEEIIIARKLVRIISLVCLVLIATLYSFYVFGWNNQAAPNTAQTMQSTT